MSWHWVRGRGEGGQHVIMGRALDSNRVSWFWSKLINVLFYYILILGSCVTYTILFNPHNNPMMLVSQHPWQKLEKRSSERPPDQGSPAGDQQSWDRNLIHVHSEALLSVTGVSLLVDLRYLEQVTSPLWLGFLFNCSWFYEDTGSLRAFLCE